MSPTVKRMVGELWRLWVSSVGSLRESRLRRAGPLARFRGSPGTVSQCDFKAVGIRTSRNRWGIGAVTVGRVTSVEGCFRALCLALFFLVIFINGWAKGPHSTRIRFEAPRKLWGAALCQMRDPSRLDRKPALTQSNSIDRADWMWLQQHREHKSWGGRGRLSRSSSTLEGNFEALFGDSLVSHLRPTKGPVGSQLGVSSRMRCPSLRPRLTGKGTGEEPTNHKGSLGWGGSSRATDLGEEEEQQVQGAWTLRHSRPGALGMTRKFWGTLTQPRGSISRSHPAWEKKHFGKQGTTSSWGWASNL